MHYRIKRFIGLSLMAAAITGSLFSCNQVKYETDSEGNQYRMIREGEGELPAENSYMMLNIAYYKKGSPDSLLYTSDIYGGSVYMKRPPNFYSPFDYIFGDLKPGDSVEYLMPAGRFFTGIGAQGIPPYMKGEDQVRLFIGFRETIEKEAYEEWRQNFMKVQQQQAYEGVVERMDNLLTSESLTIQADTDKINQYLEQKGVEAETTPYGIQYIIHEEGNGEVPAPGSSINVNYKGYLLDGTLFDTNIEEEARKGGIYNQNRPYQPFTFRVGLGQVITGWDYVLTRLPLGTRATIYIPSTFAYGNQAAGDKIPPNSVLAFDVQLLNDENRETL